MSFQFEKIHPDLIDLWKKGLVELDFNDIGELVVRITDAGRAEIRPIN